MSFDFRNKTTKSLTGYTPGEQPLGSNWVKLNTNENPMPPSPTVINELQSIAANTEVLRKYPSPQGEPLRSTLAAYFKLKPAQVLVTNGSDEALSMICQAFLSEHDTAAIPKVTYSLYPVLVAMFGAQLLECDMKQTEGHPLQIDLEALTASQAKLIFLPNPNAPTGEFISLNRLSAAVAQSPQKLWVIDEAYNDFVSQSPSSALELLNEHTNIIVSRSFSKSHALAGLRVGYMASGNELIMQALYAIKDSYNEDTIAIRLAAAAFCDHDYAVKVKQFVVAERKFLKEKLTDFGFSVLPSEGNFLFATHVLKAKEVYDELKRNHILVRHFGGGLIDNYLRITVGNHEENLQLLYQLAKITGNSFS